MLNATTAAILSVAVGFYEPRTEILEWLPVIHEVREAMDVTSAKYSDAFIMSILHRETFPMGNPKSHRDGSQYWSAIQASDAYVADARKYLIQNSVDLPWEIPRKARGLHGLYHEPIAVLIAHMEYYADVHNYRPSYMALMHKAGVGSVRAYRRHRAYEKLTVPGVTGYMTSWTQLFSIYVKWVASVNNAENVCSYAVKVKKYVEKSP